MGAKQFDKVNQVADEIIGLGTYELLPDYKAVFDINNEGVTHKEAIFVIGQTTSNAKYAWTWFASIICGNLFENDLGRFENALDFL